jgi:hypothetical protein
VVILNVTVPSGLDSKSLEALQKAVFEFGGGDPALKVDMSQYHMQLHVCGDGQLWGSAGAEDDTPPAAAEAATATTAAAAAARPRTAIVGSDEALAAAASHVNHTVAAATTVQQQLVLHALVLSLQTVKALRQEVE